MPPHLKRPSQAVDAPSLVTRSTRPSLRCAAQPPSTAERGPGVDVPLVKPRLAYVLLAANLSVYAAGAVIALTAGADASNDFFLALAKSNAEVVNGEYYRLLTSTFMHAGLLHLGLNCAALWLIAPETEAILG